MAKPVVEGAIEWFSRCFVNRRRAFALFAFLAYAGLSNGQPPSATSMAAEVTQSYTTVKNNLLRSAEKMPAENYGFKPTPEVRSFAELLEHVAQSQMHVCAEVANDPQPARIESKTSKQDVIAAVNAAFAECDKAYGSLSDANAGEAIATPRGKRSKLGLLADNTGHDREQYGIVSVYLRLKGIVPPSSEQAAAGH